MNKTTLPALGTLFVSYPSSFLLAQGPLTPPGAPAPTMKTLDQLDAKLDHRTPISALPFTISAPGSYYVTGNLTGAVAQHGITINADDVTLDLGGFELAGPSAGVTAAIRLVNAHTNATIRNGTVRGWFSTSVLAETTAGTEMRVENLRVFGSGGAGIALGDKGTAIHCEVRGNTAHGISGGALCKVLDCNASSTVTGDGINLGNFAVVVNCTASANGNDGIQTGMSSTVTRCVAESNTGNGFNADQGDVLRDCAAFSNGADGIFGTARVAAVSCTSRVNAARGFNFGPGGTLTHCSASDNATEGINAGAGSTVQGCTAFSNNGAGIGAADGSSVLDCDASQNGGTAGIAVTAGCTVTHCTANANTATATSSAGITAGNGCTVSGFAVVGAAGALKGIAVSGSRTNIAVRNGTVKGWPGDGVDLSAASTIGVADLQVNGNTGIGISTGDTSVLTGCTSRQNNGDNIRVGANSVVAKCSASSSAAGNGINASNGFSVISQCTANSNNQNGINAYQRSRISDCVAGSNLQSGIHLTFVGSVEHCVCDGNVICGILNDGGGFSDILNNNCSENSGGVNVGAGIRVSGASGNRIEGNNLLGNYRGIDALTGRNFIARNTAAGNTNADYSTVAGNSVGPIINVNGVGDISGTAGSDHPFANFRY